MSGNVVVTCLTCPYSLMTDVHGNKSLITDSRWKVNRVELLQSFTVSISNFTDSSLEHTSASVYKTCTEFGKCVNR